MSDRELLEFAAKAAGIKAIRDPNGVWRNCTGFDPMMNVFAGEQWNPLTDDGDALRMACDLGLRVYPIARTASGAACSAVGSVTCTRLAEVADQSLDTRSATRRAIVLAAAAIGKEMP